MLSCLQTSPDTNCILNFETRRSHPELFTDDNSDKVDYFELNCGNTVNTRQSLVRSVNQRRTAGTYCRLLKLTRI